MSIAIRGGVGTVCVHGSALADCPFCKPPLTIDELSERDLRKGLRLAAEVMAWSSDWSRMVRALSEHIQKRPEPHAIALYEMIMSRIEENF
jgi:hypothetical protein